MSQIKYEVEWNDAEWQELYRKFNAETVDREFRNVINDSIEDGYRHIRDTAQNELPSGGRSYLKKLYKNKAKATLKVGGVTLRWEGCIRNTHQFAKAVELGTPPHEASTKYGFWVPPKKVGKYPWKWKTPNKKGWIVFPYHKGAKAFYIFRNAHQYLYPTFRGRMDHMMSRLIG